MKRTKRKKKEEEKEGEEGKKDVELRGSPTRHVRPGLVFGFVWEIP